MWALMLPNLVTEPSVNPAQVKSRGRVVARRRLRPLDVSSSVLPCCRPLGRSGARTDGSVSAHTRAVQNRVPVEVRGGGTSAEIHDGNGGDQHVGTAPCISTVPVSGSGDSTHVKKDASWRRTRQKFGDNTLTQITFVSS